MQAFRDESRHAFGMPPASACPIAADHNMLLTQSDGSMPEVTAVARAPGEHGVSLVGARFRNGLYARGASRDHMIILTTHCAGRLECRVADERLNHVARAGNVTLCPKGATVSANGSHDYAGLALFVPADTMALAIAERGKPGATPVERCEGYDAVLLSLCHALKRQAAEGFVDGALAWVELTGEIVNRLVDVHLSEGPRVSRGKLGPDAMARIREFVRVNLDRSFGMNDLADVAMQGRSNFPRMFRRSVGLSPYQYVLRLRLQRALDLLKGERCTIAEVALRTGFADQSHLCRWAQRVYGAPPGRLVGAH